MSKILISTDLHIHPHKKNKKRLGDCLKVLDWIFKTAELRQVEDIVFIGDLFHDRQMMEVLTYQRTFEVFQKHTARIWLLIGNHDMWHNEKWDISSVIPLNAIENVTVINQATTLEIAGHPLSFLPYTRNPIKSLLDIENKGKYKILFGHIALHGALLNTRVRTFSEVLVEDDSDMTIVDATILDGWDQTFLGHYHAAQRINNNIEYVGSPLQLSYGEAFQQKHIIIYDLETHEKEYVINDFSPKHFVFKANDERLFHIKDKAFVRIQTDDLDAPENVELQQKLSENPNIWEIKFDPIQKTEKEEKVLVESAKAILLNENEMAEKYLDTFGTNGLDRGGLLKTFKKIVKGSQT
jgi:DNA repair exonuclease SbcCD nuclease subunit